MIKSQGEWSWTKSEGESSLVGASFPDIKNAF